MKMTTLAAIERDLLAPDRGEDPRDAETLVLCAEVRRLRAKAAVGEVAYVEGYVAGAIASGNTDRVESLAAEARKARRESL